MKKEKKKHQRLIYLVVSITILHYEIAVRLSESTSSNAFRLLWK